jgi:Rap1a immunity proteins
VKRILIALFVLCAVSWAQTSQRSLTENGNIFLSECGNYDTASLGCTLYVGGVIDGRVLSDNSGFCLPDHITYGQELRISIKYMQDNPQELHWATAWLIIFAHAKAFPCPAAIIPDPPKKDAK